MDSETTPTDRTSANEPSALGTYRVISFPGSGFDTVMQMGIIHAFLVTRRQPPEMVAGISVGTITATALADVLQAHAGEGASESEDEEVRVVRFSGLLEAFRNAPTTVLKGLLPDSLETNSAHALKPVELPRHFQEERESRQEAVGSRTGLIRLFDHLLRMKVTVKLISQFTRVLMGWNAADEMKMVPGVQKRASLILRGWWLVVCHLRALSQPVALLAWVQLCEVLGINGKSKVAGVEAGYIIFNQGGWLRWVQEKLLTFLLGFVPLVLILFAVPAVLAVGLAAMPVFAGPAVGQPVVWTILGVTALWLLGLLSWGALFLKKDIFSNLLKHFQIHRDLGDSHALKEALIENFDPSYYGDFRFDESVRRAIKQANPVRGGRAASRRLRSFAEVDVRRPAIQVVPIAANLGTGNLEAIPDDISVVDALMCACSSAPFFRAQTITTRNGSATFIDGTSISNDPIVPVFEEACRLVTKDPAHRWNSLRIVSVPLLPLKMENPNEEPKRYTGLVDVVLRARELRRFQDMLLDKSLIDRLNRALNGKPATIPDEASGQQTFLPAKIRLVAPEHTPHLTLRLTQAGSTSERRDLIDGVVADGCRAMIERLVTDAMPDTRTPGERRHLLEPDEELPNEWPSRDPANHATLRSAVESLRADGETITRRDGSEYVSCRKLLAAWGGMKPIPGSLLPDQYRPGDQPGPGVSEVCQRCVSCRGKSDSEGLNELRQHIRLPRTTPSPFPKPAIPENPRKGPAVVFLFSGGVFRGVFQVGFANAVSELGIQPDVMAGASVGTIVGALTGRVFQKPEGEDPVERQRQIRRLASTFLTIDRFVLTDRFADFIRHFSIHAASADFSLHDLDKVFRRYGDDHASQFSQRLRRVLSGMERLFYLSPFEMNALVQQLRAGNWQEAAGLIKNLTQEIADRYGVGMEILGHDPLQQLIEGFVFDGKPHHGTRFDHFGFPLIGTTTNLTQGRLEILRSTHARDPRFTQGLLAGSAFPVLFRPRWSWEVYRNPEQVAQFADGGIMDNLPLGAVVEYLWGKDGTSLFERRPEIPHLILTATLEPDRSDWSNKPDLGELNWTAIRSRSTQLRYNGKIGKFQQGQRDIRRILQQRAAEGDPDIHSYDLPLNLDVLAVKPQWVCGSFGFHPMLGFSRNKQRASIAHGCASTICAVADHFRADNDAHAVDGNALRAWAKEKGIAIEQLPDRQAPHAKGVTGFGPAKLTNDQIQEGQCWFRKADPTTGKRPMCPFHSKSRAAKKGDDLNPELEKIYLACGNPATHLPGKT
ncbi:MAG: patatin-like phospholipase family protein [Terrimicrobiaceae bacterium]